jgi:hypothetical protein
LTDRPTLREALADLGWFSATFSTLVGGPTLLSLLQSVFVERRLIDALQWIVDGYNTILARLAGFVEPWLLPLLEWLNGMFGWSLVLHPHWRPAFMIVAFIGVALGRGLVREGEWRKALGYAAVFLPLCFLTALGAGLSADPRGLRLLAGIFMGLALLTALTLLFIRRDRLDSRVALTILGGFATAGLVLAADFMVKLLT